MAGVRVRVTHLNLILDSDLIRHIWLAFRMALEHEMLSGSTLRFIVRARLDHIYSAPLNWPLIERMAAPTPDQPNPRL